MIRYGVLGPLAVAGDAVTAGRDRVVLAMLLLHADRVLTAGELIDAVWGDGPPSTARGQLQTCVSRLRRVLPPDAIGTSPAGYRFAAHPEELDAEVFARLVAEARERRDPALFRQALDLWRGPALAEIDSAAVRRHAAVWDERRMTVTEEWAELELATGAEPDLLSELAGLVERFPLRERLRGQLMVALFRAGRQADALAEFRRARDALRDELGVDPGRELRDLHQQILVGQLPGAELPTPARVRCLPRTVGDFTGRQAVLDRLVRTVEDAEPTGPVVLAIEGMAGSGKTTVALHVASLLGDRYPDAHLFVDLYGHSDKQPLDPAAAVLSLLRQLGVSPDAVPMEPRDRVALWRSEVARRRVLVVFDNAYTSAQLTDLLPTSPGALALVTSRRRLVGLDGVHPVSLPVLTPAEAATMLARIAGERVLAEPEAAAEVVRRCGGLPLALRLAGARLAHRPRWRVSDLVRRLGASALPELAAEDRSVADAFTLSYGHLPENAKRVFRLLGLYPGGSLDALAAAALTGLPLTDARDALDDLIDVHLLEEPEPDVHHLHDLLREFAAALAADVPDAERREALTGVLDFQLHAAAATMPAAFRELSDRDLGGPQARRPDLLAEITDPAARFERERPNLPALVGVAAAAGHPEYAWWIPRVAWWYLFTRGFGLEVAALFDRAMPLVEASGDRAGLATVANYLASGYTRVGEPGRATELLQLAIRLRAELGQQSAVASAMGNLAAVYESMGRFAEAVEQSLEARRVAALARDRTRDLAALKYLCVGCARLGRHAEALYFARLLLMSGIDQNDESVVLDSLIQAYRIRRWQGSLPVATLRRRFEVVLRRAQRLRVLPIEGETHSELAQLLRSEGRFAEAGVEHRAAVEIARQTGDRRHEAEFLTEYARTCRAAGDLARSRELCREVLDLARTARLGYETARAEAEIAESLAGTDPDRARRSWTAALAAYRAMNVPERFAVERRLARWGGEDQLRPGAGRETMVR
ncbi:AfsR/SARP family transcriptional regulator [Paractinoplanes rishiriensis]|uniref:SARP family transcriptional regulator n=1 Tax=Paractinoplanes rishiriensis TaxID=1050105 RepID=A0A919JZA2_9ACTN|nr:BTAD domain-containing putative transcriptional regulator [Actinoplanes rishiriensis]GIE97981.1 SARP family transcriptional regulator [Actinoplanes rishiriensis]